MKEPRVRWIRVDPNEYDEPGEIGMADADVVLFVSPFDIPRYVRGYYSENRRRFVIEFKYITDEPTEKKSFGPPEVTTIIGRKTGRIRGFEIDVKALDATTVALRLRAVRRAIKAVRDNAESHEHWSSQWLNPRVADRVLEDRKAEVFAGR